MKKYLKALSIPDDLTYVEITKHDYFICFIHWIVFVISLIKLCMELYNSYIADIQEISFDYTNTIIFGISTVILFYFSIWQTKWIEFGIKE